MLDEVSITLTLQMRCNSISMSSRVQRRESTAVSDRAIFISNDGMDQMIAPGAGTYTRLTSLMHSDKRSKKLLGSSEPIGTVKMSTGSQCYWHVKQDAKGII